MKRVLSILLAAAMLLALCACGGGDGSAEASASGSEAERTASGAEAASSAGEAGGETGGETAAAASEEPLPEGAVEGDLSDYRFVILSAEACKNYDDVDSVRFYFDFTNNSDEATSAWWVANYHAYQGGESLESTWSWDEVPEENNYMLNVMPGVTIRCVQQFTYDPEGGPVTFEVADAWSDSALSMEVSKDEMKDRPAERVLTPVLNPTQAAGLQRKGTDVEIKEYEFLEDYNGDPMLRVYFEYTNSSIEEPTESSFLYNATVDAMQDGVDLSTGVGAESVEEEFNDMSEVAVGETVIVARSYSLRSQSPVTVVVTEKNGSTCGLLIDVTAAG